MQESNTSHVRTVAVQMTIKNGSTNSYSVVPLPCTEDEHRHFELRKHGTETIYECRISKSGNPHCTCESWFYRRTCKHMDALHRYGMMTSPESQAKSKLRACLVIYDIPERSTVRNPSKRFRRCGARVNLSCWVIPEANIPWNTLQGIEEGGGNWHVVRFADEESEKLVQMAEKAILADLERAIRSMEKSLTRAQERLNSDGEDAYDLKTYEGRMKSVLQSTRKTIDALQVAATNFELDFGSNLLAARLAIDSSEKAAKLRAKAYSDLTKQIQSIDPGLHNAAQDDDLPVGILMDRLQDEGIDVDSERLAFAETE